MNINEVCITAIIQTLIKYIEGVIDVGYTGSIAVKLYNHSGVDYSVRRGDKISQLVVVNIDTPDLVLVEKLEDTERGNGGFGSTGR